MPFAARFVGVPLDGQLFFMPTTPTMLYAQRTVGPDGVTHVPASRAHDALNAGAYRKAPDPRAEGRFFYRFES